MTASEIAARVADIADSHRANAADAVLALEDMRSALLDLVEEYEEIARSNRPIRADSDSGEHDSPG